MQIYDGYFNIFKQNLQKLRNYNRNLFLAISSIHIFKLVVEELSITNTEIKNLNQCQT